MLDLRLISFLTILGLLRRKRKVYLGSLELRIYYCRIDGWGTMGSCDDCYVMSGSHYTCSSKDDQDIQVCFFKEYEWMQ